MPRVKIERVARSIRLRFDVDAMLVRCARERHQSLNETIEEAVRGLAEGTRQPDPAPGREPEAVPSVQRRAAGDRQRRVAVDEAARTGARKCDHPRDQRQKLGYMTRCGACGERV